MKCVFRLPLPVFLILFLTQHIAGQRVVIKQNPGLSSNVVLGQQFFHISESLYTEQEIGSGNFLSASESIDKIAFFIKSSGLSPNVEQFRILMKEVPSTLRSLGLTNYTRTGYTEVFNGTVDMSGIGAVEIPLSTPFVRTSGNNLMVMIERTDSVQHFGFVFETSNGLESVSNIQSSRRYNDSIRPELSATLLNTTFFRPAISFIHVFPTDVAVVNIIHPIASCFDTLQTIRVAIQNQGFNPIDSGSVQVTLNLGDDNPSSQSTQNKQSLQPGETEEILFPGISLASPGITFDSAFVSLAGDGTGYNDTVFSIVTTATFVNSFPIQENMETSLINFQYFLTIAGSRQLWRIQSNKYSNIDMTPDSLRPQAPGFKFMLFDSWTAPATNDFSSLMFSNCIQMPSPTVNGLPTTTLTFSMSHDTLFSLQRDSLYVCVSTDKGVTWTRLQGFSRWVSTAVTPRWTVHTVDLTAYAGQTIQLGFEGVSKFGNAFGLDNIQIKFINPVPLTLLNFKAIKLEKSNQLIWATANEWKMDVFDIERSKDGITFEKIGRIKSSGEGTYRTYEFEDVHPIAGVQYYRLKMLENNQTFSYSPIQKIDRSVYYEYGIVNPAVNHQLQMKLISREAELMSLMISDMQGKKLMGKEISVPAKKQIQINVSLPFASGTYLISIRGKNGLIQQQVVLP